jgi:AcrR family transcriptional regulator
MMVRVPVNRQTVPRAERESAILEAAAIEFTAAGFDEAKISAIARRAGMTSANVHYYFESKDALVAAVAARAYERLFVDLAQLDDPLERLHRYVTFHLASHALRGQLQAIALRCPDLADVLQRREGWVTATAAEVAVEALGASVLAAVVTGLVEVVVPDPDARVVLDHAVARLVGRRRRRTA